MITSRCNTGILQLNSIYIHSSVKLAHLDLIAKSSSSSYLYIDAKHTLQALHFQKHPILTSCYCVHSTHPNNFPCYFTGQHDDYHFISSHVLITHSIASQTATTAISNLFLRYTYINLYLYAQTYQYAVIPFVTPTPKCLLSTKHDYT